MRSVTTWERFLQCHVALVSQSPCLSSAEFGRLHTLRTRGCTWLYHRTAPPCSAHTGRVLPVREAAGCSAAAGRPISHTQHPICINTGRVLPAREAAGLQRRRGAADPLWRRGAGPTGLHFQGVCGGKGVGLCTHLLYLYGCTDTCYIWLCAWQHAGFHTLLQASGSNSN